MYKDKAVGNVVHVAETERVFGTTVRHDWAIFQCRWQAGFDAHLNRLQGHRRQPIARSGKFVRSVYSRRALDCAYAISHRARCTKTVCMAADSEERQFVRLAYSRRALGCEETTVLFFLPSWSTLLFEKGFGGRGEIWRAITQWNTKDQLPKPQTATLLRPHSGQVKQHIPEQPGWKNSKYWANIEKRNQY